MKKWLESFVENKTRVFFYTLIFIMLVLSFMTSVTGGIVITFLLIVLVYQMIKIEKENIKKKGRQMSLLSERIKRTGHVALADLPVGVLLYGDDFKIEWANRFMNDVLTIESVVGTSLTIFDEKLVKAIAEEKQQIMIWHASKSYLVTIKKDERLLYFSDQMKELAIKSRYQKEKTVIAIIFLDNYEDVTSGMDDSARSHVNSEVTAKLNDFASRHGILLKRVTEERFVAILNQEILSALETLKFSILDDVRALVFEGNHAALTLSIGVGFGQGTLPEIGTRAQSSLDLALGRGGDQAVLKDDDNKVRFYGGKTNPVEKRTRVRARMISQALQDLILQSDHIIVMGHKNPDMDVIGAGVGIVRMALSHHKKAYIVLDETEFDDSVARLVTKLDETELGESIISSETAKEIMTRQTLLVVVDTHRPGLVQEEALLNETENIVIIDHHRRGEDFIAQPTLVYMEPYASSTAELVTELLVYQRTPLHLKAIEATALLAGLIVDTKNFTLKTGTRTFDAASALRAHGADTLLVRSFMEENLSDYIKRSRLIERAIIHREQIAIAVALEDDVFSPVLIAQAADTLLSMRDIKAAFVISRRFDGRVGISARSLGDVNVQRIMEQMEGGGHLTNAATQLTGITIDRACNDLLMIIDQLYEGEMTS